MARATATDEPPIGRDREAAEIEARLEPGRVLTITGLGGTGKTTLAREVVRRAGQAGLRVVDVDLAPIDDPAAVPASIAVALGVRQASAGSLIEAIATELERSAGLLVLDNLEGVLAGRGFIAELVSAAPSARYLATSRIPLGIDGELEYRLDPLAVPALPADVEGAPASRLFLARSAIEPGALETDDRAAVVTICRALDGLPLTIELVAAWSSILSPRAIARRLADERLSLRDDARDRQSSVEAVVEATLELLRPEDEVVFRRLGALVGWFDEAAAQAIVDRPDVLERLRTLSAAALVQVKAGDEGEPAFRLLETVRSVAVHQLVAADEEASTRRRQADHFAAVGDQAAVDLRHRTFGNAAATDRLNDPNLLVAYDVARGIGDAELAVRLATDLAAAAIRSGSLSQAVERLLDARANAGPIPDWLEADALNALVSMESNRGDGGLRPLAEAALAAARRAADPTRISRTLVTLANDVALGDPASSIPIYQEAIAVAEAAGYGWVAAIARLNLANNLDGLEDPSAGSAFAAARDSFLAIGDPIGAAIATSALGDVHLAAGDVPAATAAYEAAASALRGTSVPPQQLTPTLAGLAVLAMASGDQDEAIARIGEMVQIIGESESSAAWTDLGAAATIALAGEQPLTAARVGGTIRSGELIPALRRPFVAAGARLESLLGSSRFARAQRAGRRADRAALRAELATAVEASGAERAVRLRAAYETFTPREAAVMARLAAGRRDPEIATDLGISPKTASVHVTNIKAKLGVANRVEAALIAQRLLDDARRMPRPGGAGRTTD